MLEKDLSKVTLPGPVWFGRIKVEEPHCLRCPVEATASICCDVRCCPTHITTNASPQSPCSSASSCFAPPMGLVKHLKAFQNQRQQLNHSLPTSLVATRIFAAKYASGANRWVAKASKPFGAKSPARAGAEVHEP